MFGRRCSAFRRGSAFFLAVVVALQASACTQALKVSDGQQRLNVELPDTFRDSTREYLEEFRQTQASRSPHESELDMEPLIRFGEFQIERSQAPFSNAGGSRCCYAYVASFVNPLRPEPESAEAVVQILLRPQLAAASGKHALGPAGQLERPRLLPQHLPSVVDSRPAPLAGHSGWATTIQQTWPKEPGAWQTVTQVMGLAADVTPAGAASRRQWLLAVCQASHAQEHVNRYLSDMVEMLGSAHWSARTSAKMPK